MRKISILAMIISICLCACGDASEVNSIDETETINSAEVEDVPEETTSDEQPIEEAQENIVEEQPSEVVVEEGPQNVGQWAKSVDKTEPKLTIWNDATKEGTILENGEKYTVKAGDQLILCYEGEETYFTMKKSSMLTSDISSTIYRIIDILEQPLEPTDVEFSHKINGVEYIYQVTLVSEDAVASSDGDSAEQVSGKEWAASLEYDIPKLIAWNDELNTKVEIEEGQEYAMQPGDVLAIHAPQNYIPFKTYPENFFNDWETGQGYYVINYNAPENNNPVNLVIEGWLGEDEYNLTCTLIPPTE